METGSLLIIGLFTGGVLLHFIARWRWRVTPIRRHRAEAGYSALAFLLVALAGLFGGVSAIVGFGGVDTWGAIVNLVFIVPVCLFVGIAGLLTYREFGGLQERWDETQLDDVYVGWSEDSGRFTKRRWLLLPFEKSCVFARPGWGRVFEVWEVDYGVARFIGMEHGSSERAVRIETPGRSLELRFVKKVYGSLLDSLRSRGASVEPRPESDVPSATRAMASDSGE